MQYQQVVDWLFQQVPNYQHQGGSAYKPGLERITELLHCIGNPQLKVKTIHIAGTNGKGSVSHIMANAFSVHGYKTGLFTSPHIVDFRERIKINGILIDEDFVVRFVTQNKHNFDWIQPSFFEITTAMALAAFVENNCDIAIIETGLGGRLDSTNIIHPEISIITNIGLDHTAFLGNTLPEIAFEKAGIIKEKIPVVIGDMLPELYPVFQHKADQLNASLVFSETIPSQHYESDLLGQFQQRNLHTAKTALNVLKNDWELKEEVILASFKTVKSGANFIGRLHQIGNHPLMLIDAAHNVEGIQNLLKEISYFKFEQLHILYGASNDKEWQTILKLFPENAKLYLTEFDSKRSVKATEFEEELKNSKKIAKVYPTVESALTSCKTAAKSDDLIVICGSFYLMEKII